jgi:hypothetical protein
MSAGSGWEEFNLTHHHTIRLPAPHVTGSRKLDISIFNIFIAILNTSKRWNLSSLI